MTKKTIAKFNVAELTTFGNKTVGGKVVLVPVYGDSEENKEFWKQTPNGRIELYIDNPEAFEVFKNLGQFYVEFTKAE